MFITGEFKRSKIVFNSLQEDGNIYDVICYHFWFNIIQVFIFYYILMNIISYLKIIICNKIILSKSNCLKPQLLTTYCTSYRSLYDVWYPQDKASLAFLVLSYLQEFIVLSADRWTALSFVYPQIGFSTVSRSSQFFLQKIPAIHIPIK